MPEWAPLLYNTLFNPVSILSDVYGYKLFRVVVVFGGRLSRFLSYGPGITHWYYPPVLNRNVGKDSAESAIAEGHV